MKLTLLTILTILMYTVRVSLQALHLQYSCQAYRAEVGRIRQACTVLA